MRTRIIVAALTLSAAGFVGIVNHEGYRSEAYVPIPNDVPTLGFGSTTHEDGSPVELGDRTTPPKALTRALKDVEKFEGALKQCVKVPLHQHEFDAYLSFSYNVGSSAFCRSTLVAKLNNQEYEAACEELRKWVYAGGRKVQGLVNRREQERKQCLGIA